MNEYLSGNKLYGDDFDHESIQKWFIAEEEGYSETPTASVDYRYNVINKVYGFKYLDKSEFKNALGFGAAFGSEFIPIIDKIKKLTIIEPSLKLRSKNIGHIQPEYHKPNPDGNIQFDSNSFDLITCFGVLHHIPNVSHVFNELVRVLAPGGYMLIREPIVSMGDWTKDRPGLTKNERGIPVEIFDRLIQQNQLIVVNKAYCFTMTSVIVRVLNVPNILKRKSYILFDKYLSKLFKWNVTYHPQTKLRRIAPNSIYYVIKKPN